MNIDIHYERGDSMDKEKLISYIKWLVDTNDSLATDTVDKETVRIMLLSIIGEMMTSDCNNT